MSISEFAQGKLCDNECTCFTWSASFANLRSMSMHFGIMLLQQTVGRKGLNGAGDASRSINPCLVLADMILASRQWTIILIAPSRRNFKAFFGRFGEQNSINTATSCRGGPSARMLSQIMVLESFKRITRGWANVTESFTNLTAAYNLILIKTYSKGFLGISKVEIKGFLGFFLALYWCKFCSICAINGRCG